MFNTAATYIPTASNQDGESIAAEVDLAAVRRYETEGVLLIHHHNAAGMRGEVVGLKGLTCASDDDCAADPWSRICDTVNSVCVACVEHSHCLEGGYCDQNECVYDCTDDNANACSAGSFCDQSTGEYLHDCTLQGASACPAGTYCDTGSGLCVNSKLIVRMTDLDVGDTNCPFGGKLIDTGLDDNNNGVLDAGEVENSEYVCNGSDGTDGIDGKDGEDGCGCATSRSNPTSALILFLVVFGLIAARRRRS